MAETDLLSETDFLAFCCFEWGCANNCNIFFSFLSCFMPLIMLPSTQNVCLLVKGCKEASFIALNHLVFKEI